MKTVTKIILPFLLVALAFFGVTAEAAVLVDTTAVDAAYVDLNDTVGYFEGKAWPLVFLMTGITIGISLFKRFTRTAAR